MRFSRYCPSSLDLLHLWSCSTEEKALVPQASWPRDMPADALNLEIWEPGIQEIRNPKNLGMQIRAAQTVGKVLISMGGTGKHPSLI